MEGKRLEIETMWRRFGKPIVDALHDPEVVEIMVNADGVVRLERLQKGVETTEHRLAEEQRNAALEAVAHLLRTTISRERPILEGEIPGDGSRIEGVVPPVVDAPAFCIRKRASKVFPLTSYVEQGRMTPRQFEALDEAVEGRDNILVVGGTGSGKTTLVNALLDRVSLRRPGDRVVILEDTRELQCATENFLRMCTTPTVSMHELLRATLRLRPERIVVGEVRDSAALALLKAWNTGHPGGISTVHANGTQAGLTRIEQLASEATGGFRPRDEVAAAVNVVVFISRSERGPLVKEVARVEGLAETGYRVRALA